MRRNKSGNETSKGCGLRDCISSLRTRKLAINDILPRGSSKEVTCLAIADSERRIMERPRSRSQLPSNLPQLQNLIKRDPLAYKDEVLCVSLVQLVPRPEAGNKERSDKDTICCVLVSHQGLSLKVTWVGGHLPLYHYSSTSIKARLLCLRGHTLCE